MLANCPPKDCLLEDFPLEICPSHNCPPFPPGCISLQQITSWKVAPRKNFLRKLSPFKLPPKNFSPVKNFSMGVALHPESCSRNFRTGKLSSNKLPPEKSPSPPKKLFYISLLHHHYTRKIVNCWVLAIASRQAKQIESIDGVYNNW